MQRLSIWVISGIIIVGLIWLYASGIHDANLAFNKYPTRNDLPSASWHKIKPRATICWRCHKHQIRYSY